MPTFLISTDGIESVGAYPHSCDAIVAAADNSPGCRHVVVKVIPYDIGTQIVDLLTGDIFCIKGITPALVRYEGVAGTGKVAREHIESIFEIYRG